MLGLIVTDDIVAQTAASALRVEFPSTCCANGAEIPESFSVPLTKKHQKKTNACAGFSGSSLCEALNWHATGEAGKVFSAWWLYRHAAQRAGFGRRDEGTSIISILETLAELGCCSEAASPFPDGRFVNDFPDQAPYAEAKQHRIGQFVSLRGYDEIWRYLTTTGPLLMGTQWRSGMAAARGCRPITYRDVTDDDLYGYHAQLVYGWSSHTDQRGRHRLKVWNSHDYGGDEYDADCFEAFADDRLSQIIGASEIKPFDPKPVTVWRPKVLPA